MIQTILLLHIPGYGDIVIKKNRRNIEHRREYEDARNMIPDMTHDI